MGGAARPRPAVDGRLQNPPSDERDDGARPAARRATDAEDDEGGDAAQCPRGLGRRSVLGVEVLGDPIRLPDVFRQGRIRGGGGGVAFDVLNDQKSTRLKAMMVLLNVKGAGFPLEVRADGVGFRLLFLVRP